MFEAGKDEGFRLYAKAFAIYGGRLQTPAGLPPEESE